MQSMTAENAVTQSRRGRSSSLSFAMPTLQRDHSDGIKRKRSQSSGKTNRNVKSKTEAETFATEKRCTNQCRIGRVVTPPQSEPERHSIQSQHSQILPLSRHNLRLFDQAAKSKMASSTASRKRSSSQLSAPPLMSDSSRCQSRSSSSTAAFYRYRHLSAVQIHIHTEPPGYLQAAIDDILNAFISEQRLAELNTLADGLRNACFKNVKAQSGEDNFIEPIYTTLKSLKLRNVSFNEKAEWREELKPKVQDELLNSIDLSFITRFQRPSVAAMPGQSQKHQHSGANAYISPHSSSFDALKCAQGPTLAPASFTPSSAQRKSISPVKLPYPDVTIGIDLSALLSAVSSGGFTHTWTAAFFSKLQTDLVQNNLEGPPEPILTPVPALRALDLAFPFAVIEGKAYSTGKQIFEAENQAAVSAACALKIQIDLESLVSYTKATDVYASGSIVETALEPEGCPTPPLFFSITTQGPIHELWVHWTIVEDEVRKFESKLLDSCNILILKQAKDFIQKLNNICQWGTGAFMDSVVRRLGVIARKANV